MDCLNQGDEPNEELIGGLGNKLPRKPPTGQKTEVSSRAYIHPLLATGPVDLYLVLRPLAQITPSGCRTVDSACLRLQLLHKEGIPSSASSPGMSLAFHNPFSKKQVLSLCSWQMRPPPSSSASPGVA